MNTLSEISNLVNQALEAEKSKETQRLEILRNIVGLMDLTTLEGTDNDAKVIQLCNKALSSKHTLPGLSSPAAVCVYPVFVPKAKEFLQGTNVRVAAVAGGFPSGQMPLHLRLAEVEWTVEQGADEIDMVISRGKLLAGDEQFVADEVARHKQACGNAHLKVILETGELNDAALIKQASEIAIASGADFIKTSTGKVQPAATLEASWIMLHVIKEHYLKTGQKIGFKPAGGIATADDAINYYLLVRHIVGNEWLNPHLFRFGASRLFDNVMNELMKD